LDKKEFVNQCGKLLMIAKPNLISTTYMQGNEIKTAKEWDKIVSDAEYAVVACENGYHYYIDITANSLCAIAEAIFKAMAYK